MRNVMLGHSGDGKTTFVASAYAQLQNPTAGFTLRTCAEKDHHELMSFAKDINNGCYPPSTAARSEYRFTLKHEGNSVLDFTWADYRGAALMDSASATDTQSLLADLRRADSIQVFVDAAAVAAGKRVVGKLGRITNLIAEAIVGQDRSVAIAIILTKYDLVPPARRSADLLAPVRGLMDAAKAGNHVTKAFCVAAGPSPGGLFERILIACARVPPARGSATDLAPPARGSATDLLAALRSTMGTDKAGNHITRAFRWSDGPSPRELAERIDRPILFALRQGLTAERNRRAQLASERQSEWYSHKVEADKWKAEKERHARQIREYPVTTWLGRFFGNDDHYALEENAGHKVEANTVAADRAWAAARRYQSELDHLMPSVQALDAYLIDLDNI